MTPLQAIRQAYAEGVQGDEAVMIRATAIMHGKGGMGLYMAKCAVESAFRKHFTISGAV